jgi:CTP:molybdopterin cytidylyltransferase MocA
MSFAAILSASRAPADSSGGLRACLHFAGQTLVEYQARQAVRAGADRIFVMVSVRRRSIV